MKHPVEKARCTGCSACASSCPKQCISMVDDTEGFWYPEIDRAACIDCGLCEKTCPVFHRAGSDHTPAAYAAYCKDEKLRRNSSSGGVFSVLAKRVIDTGGVVFGARFDGHFCVRHDFAAAEEELARFRGSKYVQSRIGDSFLQAKFFLDQGRPVYFSGTPCQIGGLKAFLRKEYENLICQDLVCHGVPSPKVWKQYVAFRETETGTPALNISLREKSRGWKQYSVAFEFEDGTEYRQILDQDPYMRLFLKNVCLRPSCHHCAFKMPYGQSDITLADFWGVEQILPVFSDDKGTSLVLLNTEKGRTFFASASGSLIAEKTDLRGAVLRNPAEYRSAKANLHREKFFQDLDSEDFIQLARRYTADPITEKARKKLRYILSELCHFGAAQ